MREMGTQWVREPPHELPQSDSVERTTKQHKGWAKIVGVHALVSPFRFNREYLLRHGFQGC